jgi:hypothetical protein
VSAKREADEGEVVQACKGQSAAFVVSGEAEAGGPGEASLHHPSPRQQDEAAFCFSGFNDLHSPQPLVYWDFCGGAGLSGHRANANESGRSLNNTIKKNSFEKNRWMFSRKS